MGAWGNGPFESDEAYDTIATLADDVRKQLIQAIEKKEQECAIAFNLLYTTIVNHLPTVKALKDGVRDAYRALLIQNATIVFKPDAAKTANDWTTDRMRQLLTEGEEQLYRGHPGELVTALAIFAQLSINRSVVQPKINQLAQWKHKVDYMTRQETWKDMAGRLDHIDEVFQAVTFWRQLSKPHTKIIDSQGDANAAPNPVP